MLSFCRNHDFADTLRTGPPTGSGRHHPSRTTTRVREANRRYSSQISHHSCSWHVRCCVDILFRLDFLEDLLWRHSTPPHDRLPTLVRMVLHRHPLSHNVAKCVGHMGTVPPNGEGLERHYPWDLLGSQSLHQLWDFQCCMVCCGRLCACAFAMVSYMGVTAKAPREDWSGYRYEHGCFVSAIQIALLVNGIRLLTLDFRSGVCAIVKGVYVIQLGQGDFSFNGKELTIWTAVETATAIIAASIPILRVFFKETISSYSRSHTRTNKSVPLSRLNQSQHSATTTTVHAMGKGKEGYWTVIEENGDDSSQRGILDDEELGRVHRMTAYEDDHIMQTNTVTVTIESDAQSDHKARSFLGIAR